MHYIDSKNEKSRSLFLGLKELNRSHTGDYVKEAITDVLDEHGLDLSQIYRCISDNGSNFVAAFSNEIEGYK